MSIEVSSFGEVGSKKVDLIKISNSSGSMLSVTNFGAHIVSVVVPDSYGSYADVCLGFDDAQDYCQKGHAYMGATVGRYCNRIRNAAFSISGVEYRGFANEKNNMLHGGQSGFDQKIWEYEVFEDENRVCMHYLSPDMEEGFPGNVHVEVSFTLTQDNQIVIAYSAVSDKDTAINLTNHSYFNLSATGDVMDHVFFIDADYISEVDDELLPTGWLADVGNTPFDLRKPRSLRECLGAKLEHPMFDDANGFDVNYVLNGEGHREVACVFERSSGRKMRVFTDMPGMQFYSGQGLSVLGKGGAVYQPYSGFALETQFPPDSINQSDEGISFLKAGEKWKSTTIYAFETIEE